MLIQAPIPRTRFAITPTNVRPIHVCLDMTPTRQFSNHNSILNLTQRLDDRLPIRAVVENKHPQSIIVNRVHGNSFSQNQSNKEIQNQIQELTKQRENMAQILSEAIRKTTFSKSSQIDKTEQALQFQVNLDQFQDQITQLTSRLEDLIIENTQLQESYQSQQFYIEQLEYQENDQLNITQHFGQM